MSKEFKEINIHEVLSWISPDTNRLDWLKVATAIKAGGYDFSTFDEWSSSGGDYNRADTKSAWRSINSSALARIENPDAYLVSFAKKQGYQPTAPIKAKSSEELQREKAARAAQQAENDRKEKANQARAAAKAQRLWNASAPFNTNPYLLYKGAKAAGELRQISTEQAKAILYGSQKYPINGSKGPLEGDLLIFLIGDETGITTCQLIDEKGSKHILKGGRKAGCNWEVGENKSEIQIGEGLATVLTAYEAKPINTISAIDASGVLKEAIKQRALNPDSKIIILGEPDKKTGAPNKQHIKAQRAAGAYLAMPTVGDDFNDMHLEMGLEAVREAIESASLSQDIAGNRIDIDALVTLDGRELTVYEAATKHQGLKIDHPVGSGKLWINSDRFSGKGQNNYLRFDLIGLEGGKELIAAKRAEATTSKEKKELYCANQYTGIELAKCALYVALRQIKKFGPIFKDHSKWLMFTFPGLEQHHLSRIIRLIDLQLRDRKIKSKDRFKTYPKRGEHLHLPRKNGQVQWSDEIFETKKSIIGLGMEHGAGKTAVGINKAMNRSFNGKTNVYLTLFQSLTHDAAKRIGTEHYKEDKDKISFFDQLNNGLTICLPSLMRTDINKHLERIGVLCIDEIEQVLSCFAGGDDSIFSTYKKEDVFEKFKQIIIKAEHVYIADADLSEATIQWVCDVRGVNRSDVLHVTCEPTQKDYETELSYSQNSRALNGCIKEIKELMHTGERPAIAVSSAKDGRAVHEALQAAGYRGNLYAKQRGFNQEELDKLLANPDEATKELDYIIYSSLINTGVSIEHKSPHFTLGYAIFNTLTLAPTSCLQALRRVRYLKKFKVRVYFAGNINGYQPVSAMPSDLIGLINWQKDRGNADRGLFTEELEILLNKYGFNPTRSNSGTGAIISFKKEDIQSILNAQDIEEPHQLITNHAEWFENLRFEIRELFNDVSPEIVESYLTERHKQIPERYKRLTTDQKEIDNKNEALRIARELFSRCLKAKIRPKEIELTMELISSHWPTLRAGGFLPSDWGKRPPKTRGAGTLKAILEWWGLDAEMKQYSKGVNQLEVSLNANYETIAKPAIEAEPNASTKNEERDREIIRLRSEGLSVLKIHASLKGSEHECSEGTIKNVIKKHSGKQVCNLSNSNTYNTENVPSCPIKKQPDNRGIDTSPVSDIADSEGWQSDKRKNLAWLMPKLEKLRKQIEIPTQATFDGAKTEPFIHYADTSEPLKEITIKYDPACPYALKALEGYAPYLGRIEAEIRTATRVSFLSRKASNDPVYLAELVAGLLQSDGTVQKIKFIGANQQWPTITLEAA